MVTRSDLLSAHRRRLKETRETHPGLRMPWRSNVGNDKVPVEK
jgi:hypothetical protein